MRDAGEAAFAKDTFNMTFLSGGVTFLSYWCAKPPAPLN